MRGDGRSGRMGDSMGRNGVNFSDRGFGADRGRGDFTTGSSRQDFQSRVDRSRTQGDRAWSDRFGGNSDRRVGDATRTGSARDIARGDFSGKRDFGDRKFVDGKYQSWRRGGDGKISDQRDWSGRWKDGDRFGAADRVRDHWRGDWGKDDFPFHDGWKGGHWYGDHDHWNHWGYWNHWHGHDSWFWWGWATAPLITSWFNYGWGTPYYWDYGPGEYINCYDDVIYVNGLWYQPAPVYYDTATAIAERAPDWNVEQAQQVEWLPLGVFAVARDGVPDNNMLVQLAVTKDGVIGGTATNKATGASFPVEGTVDKQSQRAVWKYTDDKNQPVMMETSVYNLTQSEATGLVHYGPDNIQVVEFVRLETPTAAEALPSPTK
jgi:hypothetical protein